MPGYTWLNLTTALAQFAQRLNTDFSDPNSFWKQPEAIIYLQQSLRLFNALTFQNKTNFVYNSPDLWNSLGSLAGSPRLRTLTDTYAYQQLEYMLLEPASGGTWTGTKQFNMAQIAQALQSRRDEMIQVSNCNLTLLPGVPLTPNTRRTFVPDYVIDIPRVRYATGSPVSLGPALENDYNANYDPNQGSGFGLSTDHPHRVSVPINPGDVLDSFTGFQNSGIIFLTFYNSSNTSLLVVDVGTATTVTAPAGSTYFLISADSATLDSHNIQFNINTINSVVYSIVPNSGNFETDFSTGVNDLSQPLSMGIGRFFASITPQSTFLVVPGGTLDPGLVLQFYDSGLNLIASIPLTTQGVTYTAPPNTAFWSVELTLFNPDSGSGVELMIAQASGGGGGGCPVNLFRDDTVALEFYESPLYQIPAGIPQTYQMSSEPPLSFDVDIPPALPGTYELIILKSGVAFNPPASTLLGIPDDYVWTLIWGTLADLLGRESEATDRQRAAYALKRYQDGLVLLQKTPWIMLGSVNGVACTTDSIYATDRYMPGWDCSPSTFGPCIVTGGIDFLAAPINAGIGLTVLGNMPVPSIGADFLQISRSDWDIVLDLAQCLAAWKQGSAEFEQALELEQRAIQACAAENARLQSFGTFSDILMQRGQDQERNLNRYNSKGKG